MVDLAAERSSFANGKWILLLFLTIARSGRARSGTVASLTFELPDKQQSCFTHDFSGSARFIFEYRVIRGGNHDVDVTVSTPNGKIIYKEAKRTKDETVLTVSTGAYEFCFGNQFSSITHKVVYFNIRTENVDGLAAERGLKVPTVLTAAETSCDEIHGRMTSVMEHQKDYRLWESVGRYTAEILNQHVLWWSVGQAGIILVAGLGQVIILKTLFTERRKFGQPCNPERTGC